jgi:predicted lipid-binding transport protein (Tim44 family)
MPAIDAESGDATTAAPLTMTPAIRERCSACGAATTSDQRYCVECGQRHGAARVPLPPLPTKTIREGSVARRPQPRPSRQLNTALVAVIGTLLLAMGVGVLIGRSGNKIASVRTPPAQVVTIAGAAGAASPPTTATRQPAAAGATEPKKPSTANGSTKPTQKKPAAPTPKVVKVGSAGKGSGYQHGHFTGNFFGTGAE